MKHFLLSFLLFIFSFSSISMLAQGEHIFSQDSTHEIRLSFDIPNFWDSLTQNYDDNYPNIPYIMADAVIDG
ncbi:MAG: hypothetical protein AAF696_16070, partial [Bacteroidota bacterium]